MIYSGEIGLKFALQSASHYTAPQLVRFAQLAHKEGFNQVWVNDNLGQRNIFVVLAAMAARTPIKLGTSIVVPYFRNPVDIADSLAALSELTDGREFSVGIARGERSRAGRQVEMPNPVAAVRESTLAIRSLLAGEAISFRDYPICAAYFHLRQDHKFSLAFAPPAPLRFYCGGHGPEALLTAGEIMDGVLLGDHYVPLARAGRVAPVLSIAQTAADSKGKTLFNICEVDISVARDRRWALEFARPYAAQVLMNLASMGFTRDEFHAIGVEPRLVESLKEARATGAAADSVATLVSDDVVRSCYIAGDPEECRDQLAVLLDTTARLNFGQVALAKLGPDYDDAIPLLRHKVLQG